MDIENSKKRLLDSEQELSWSQRLAIYNLLDQLQKEIESIEEKVKTIKEIQDILENMNNKLCDYCSTKLDEDINQLQKERSE